MNNPKVSVLMPVYNGEAYLKEAINSVLAQSFKNFEFLIINDGSTDKSAEIIKSYFDQRIKILNNNKNLGIQKTLNHGLNLACGEYIARIDADDEWIDVDKLKKQVELLDNNPKIVLVGTGAIVIDNLGNKLWRYFNKLEDRDIRKNILSRNQFLHSSALMKTQTVLEVGGYDESDMCQHVEDYDLWLKLGTKGKLANLSDYAIKYRTSVNQISSINFIKQVKKNFYLIKKYRNFYPGYFRAIARNYCRLLFYGYLKMYFFKKY